MKTLNTFLEQTGYLKVKSPDEQKFVDKHEVAVKADRAGNKDDVFKATNVKAIDRRKERKGYNPGEDESVYEALKGNQHKIDANKNGKVDAHDFHLLRKRKKMKEEAEQIDELSKKTLGSYVKKASGAEQPKNVMSPKNLPLTKIAAYQGDSETGHFGKRFNQHTYDKAERLRKNRETGIKRAVDKITKEEAEQIDELSKKTLGSYVKKAKDQMSRSDQIAGIELGQRHMGARPGAKERKHNIRASKRYFGIDKAVDRLTKEEAELVEGMSSADRYSATHASAKALVKSINDHLNAHKDAASKHKNSYSNKKGPTWGHVGDIENLHGQLKDIHDRLASQGEYMSTVHEEVELDEKTLTPAEMKKREEVAKALKRENPKMPMGKKMAIATATAKKVAEETLTDLIADLSEANQATLLSVFDKLSEENQVKFVEACETPEGVEAMLDFAIQNRGR